MKKLLLSLILLHFTCLCLHAEKQINYRGIFPADRKPDAIITNYILLKENTEVEFAIEEQGKGPSDLVKISEIKSTSNSELRFSGEQSDLSSLKIIESGIYQVTLVPARQGGGEIRFILTVKERPAGQEIVDKSSPKQQEQPVEVKKTENGSPVNKENADENAVTKAKVEARPHKNSDISINQVSIGRIESAEDFQRRQNEKLTEPEAIEKAKDKVQMASETRPQENLPLESEPGLSSEPASIASETVQESRSPQKSVALIAPAEGFFVNPLNGFVFSLPEGYSIDELKAGLDIAILPAQGEFQNVAGQFFSIRAGQMTFLPEKLIPGAVYSISMPDNRSFRRAAFPELKADIQFLPDRVAIRLSWNQKPELKANPLGQVITLQNSLISIVADEQNILTLDLDQAAPYGVVGDFSYSFRPYEMVFELDAIAADKMKSFEILVAAHIDGQPDFVNVFKQSFSRDYRDVAALPAASQEFKPVPMLADLPEEARYLLQKSFSAYDKEAEANKAWPEGVSWSDSGSLWVVDSQLRRLYNFSDSGKLKLAFGRKGEKPGEMGLPIALTLKNGRIYIADTALHCLHKFAEDGSFQLQIKSEPERGAFIDVPGSLTFRGEELWVLDRGRSRVSCFDVEGKYLGGFGDGGLIVAPLAIRSDDEGLFVLEKTGIIKKFSPMGEQIAGFQTGCAEPRGFEVDPWGSIWVCDARQLQVVRFNQKGRVLSVIKAPPAPRPWMPTGVAMRKDGLLAVSDAENKKIHLFSPEHNY